ncbi:hypothetical protein [Halomonas sp. ND22Bw]|uniref:hypothetical protein n=1 Tax=Halomonas sp. ND22Bw TaxID=2054178 RepID=UPI0015E7A790
MYCRKPERRVELVEKYVITPVFYSSIIPGQEKRSCTGDPLTDEYFLFSYKERDGDLSDTFYCGKVAAEHFLELTNSTRPPHFNPLKSIRSPGAQSSSSGGSPSSTKKQLHPASQQLLNAINLVIVCWDSPPGVPLTAIKGKVEKYGHNAPYPSEVKGVNSIIKKGGRPLPAMIRQLRDKGHAIRDFRFEVINTILKDKYPDEPSFLE